MLDKDSVWGYDNGLRSVIPTALLFGLVGYPFVLPDMIGGNGYSTDDVIHSSNSSSTSLLSSLTRTILPDRELYIRWLELTTFLPAMQFSVVPWQFDEETVAIGRKFAVGLRMSLVNEAIEKAAKDSVETGIANR
jgi:alpha-glucosidase (family GH31 glycosyl hydrolase)